MTLITGNTYPVRKQIKALGGVWNKARQGWLVPDHNAATASALAGQKPAPSEPRKPVAPCWECKDPNGFFRPYGAATPVYCDSCHAKRRAAEESRYVSNVTRFSSGAVVYTNKRGRCEDAPCCGCCS
jgi:hypothetical protein